MARYLLRLMHYGKVLQSLETDDLQEVRLLYRPPREDAETAWSLQVNGKELTYDQELKLMGYDSEGRRKKWNQRAKM